MRSARTNGKSSKGLARKIADGDRILFILLLAGLLQALIGIWQFGLRETGPEHFSIFGRFYRAYGTYEQPNPFGGFMNLTLFPALGALTGRVALIWRSPKTRCGMRKEATEPTGILTRLHAIVPSWSQFAVLMMIVGTGVATLLALIFSWSRGAWLGFAAGGAILLLFLPKRRWQGLALLTFVAVLGVGLFMVGTQLQLIPTDISARLSSFSQDLRFDDARGQDISDSNYAVLERLAHWQAALDMARDHFWLGAGFGNYQAAYPGYALINWPDALGHAHNYYLNILAETGVVGFAAYVILWSSLLIQTLRLLNRLEWPRRGVVLGLFAAMVALSFHHLVDKLYVNNIYVHLGAMLGLLQLHKNSG